MTSKQGAITIGEIAAESRVNIQTVRYDERRGLLATPERTPVLSLVVEVRAFVRSLT